MTLRLSRASTPPNARFISHPFRSGQSPLDYARSAFAEEDELITILRFNAQGLAVEHWTIGR
jgi:hypothetical protein